MPIGNILFVDDETYEHDILKSALKTLKYKNKVVSAFNGLEALEYLKSTTEKTFFILCDINMPTMNGLDFKREIEGMPELKSKSIPFLYHSNSSSPANLKLAYTLNIQGCFQKADSLEGTISTIKLITSFFENCIHPYDLV